MNRGLTPQQVGEILEGSARVDVPAGRLIAAAEEIRAALLPNDGAGETAPVVVTPVRSHRRRAVLAAAALTVATTLSFASAGALPGSAQSRVAQVAAVLGINLPNPDDARGPDTGIDSEPADAASTPGDDPADAAGGSPPRAAYESPGTTASDPSGTAPASVATASGGTGAPAGPAAPETPADPEAPADPAPGQGNGNGKAGGNGSDNAGGNGNGNAGGNGAANGNAGGNGTGDLE